MTGRYPVICKYFKSGTCKLGDSCRFSHSFSGSSTSSTIAYTAKTPSSTNNSSSDNAASTTNNITTNSSGNIGGVDKNKKYQDQNGSSINSPILNNNNTTNNGSTTTASSSNILNGSSSFVSNSTNVSSTTTTSSSSSSSSTNTSLNNNTTTNANNIISPNLNSSGGNFLNNLNISNLSLEDSEEFISYNCRINPSRMAGRRPFLQMVVLYAADPRVMRFAKEVQNSFLDKGIDVFLKTEENNNQSIKTENLAEIITGSKADCLIVLGDRNLKNRSCQAKRRGKLVEMDIEEVITCIWNEWSLLLPKEDEELTDEQVFNLLEKHCKLRHVKDRLQKAKASINEFKDFKIPERKNNNYNGNASSHIIDPTTFLDEKIASKLTSAQKTIMRFHLQVVEAIEYVEDMPFITHCEKLTSTRGSSVGPEISSTYNDSKPVISEINREKLLDQLNLILPKIEKMGDRLSELGAPLWNAYFEEYTEKLEYQQQQQQQQQYNEQQQLLQQQLLLQEQQQQQAASLVDDSSTVTSIMDTTTSNSNSGNNSNGNNSLNSSNNGISVSNGGGSGSSISGDDGVEVKAGQWRCLRCTFINDDVSVLNCSMCDLPNSNVGNGNQWSTPGSKSKSSSNNKKLSVQTSYNKPFDEKNKKDAKLSIQPDPQQSSSKLTVLPPTQPTPTPTPIPIQTQPIQPIPTPIIINNNTNTVSPILSSSSSSSSFIDHPTSPILTSTTSTHHFHQMPISLHTSAPVIPILSNGIQSSLSSSQPIPFSAAVSGNASPLLNSIIIPTEHYEDDFPLLHTNDFPPLGTPVSKSNSINNSNSNSNNILTNNTNTNNTNNKVTNNNSNNKTTLNNTTSPSKKQQTQQTNSPKIKSQLNQPQSQQTQPPQIIDTTNTTIRSTTPPTATIQQSNYYNIFANNNWETSLFSQENKGSNIASTSSFSSDPYNWSPSWNNYLDDSNGNVNSNSIIGSGNSVSSLFGSDLNNIFQTPFSNGIFNNNNNNNNNNNINNNIVNNVATSATSSSASTSSASSTSLTQNSLSSLQQQYHQQVSQQQFQSFQQQPSSSSSASSTNILNNNNTASIIVNNLNHSIANNNSNQNLQIQMQIQMQQQQAAAQQINKQQQVEQFERDKQRARELVLEKYKHQQPPQRPCCYCGEESMLECYNCAKTGYATYFCSKEHQTIMWKEHMLVHQFHAYSNLNNTTNNNTNTHINNNNNK